METIIELTNNIFWTEMIDGDRIEQLPVVLNRNHRTKHDAGAKDHPAEVQCANPQLVD